MLLTTLRATNSITSEVIGTALLILLGNGVVAGVLLSQSKGENSGWIVITFGPVLAHADLARRRR